MKRRIEGLHQASPSGPKSLPEGLFLVRVGRAQHCFRVPKPYCTITLSVLEPTLYAGHSAVGRIYCTPKALWKLNWFLRDFGYDVELLGRDEVDDKCLVGLRGVVKLSYAVVNGTSLPNFDGFAPACQWEELSCTRRAEDEGSGVAV